MLRWIGAKMASTSMVVGVSAVFLGALVAGFLLPDSLSWLSRLQTVSSVLSLVLLLALHHTTHRDQIAVQRKLDELIAAQAEADDDVIRLEAAPEDKLDEIDERQTGASS